MKKSVPESAVVAGHADFDLLSALAQELVRLAGGLDRLEEEIPPILRECIDHLINTPRTSRRSFNELEKVEKTFIGTHVEIAVRKFLRLPRGDALDVSLLGCDVDIKFTTGTNWMIPPEAFESPCILVAADEKSNLCYLGIFVAHREAMRARDNRDDKGTPKASAFKDIFWLLRDEPYPPNFWQTAEAIKVAKIFAGRSGDDRIVTLFDEVRERPVPRTVIVDVGGAQLDPMRRSRGDGRGGSRERLRAKGILLMSGTKHKSLIENLGLPRCSRSEFISLALKPDDARWRLVEAWEAGPRNEQKNDRGG